MVNFSAQSKLVKRMHIKFMNNKKKGCFILHLTWSIKVKSDWKTHSSVLSFNWFKLLFFYFTMNSIWVFLCKNSNISQTIFSQQKFIFILFRCLEIEIEIEITLEFELQFTNRCSCLSCSIYSITTINRRKICK